MTVRDIYDEVCDVLLEPEGLTTGIITESTFLDVFNNVYQDFYQQTGIIKTLYNIQEVAAQETYTEPDQAVQVQEAMHDGVYLNHEPALDMDQLIYGWRNESGQPRRWREDRIAVKSVALQPVPSTTGYSVAVAAPLYGVISSMVAGDISLTSGSAFYGTMLSSGGEVYTDIAGIMLGTWGAACANTWNLTLVATSKPQEKWCTLDTILEQIPVSFLQYLKYGTLAQLFQLDAECKDELRARYCASRYLEGLRLGQAISQEALEEPINAV